MSDDCMHRVDRPRTHCIAAMSVCRRSLIARGRVSRIDFRSLIFLFGQIIALPIIMQAVTVIGSAGQSYGHEHRWSVVSD